jgi:hypothetical protein
MNAAVIVQLHRHKPEDVAKKQGWEVLTKMEVLGQGAQAPGYVTLCRTGGRHPEFVVHFFNSQDGGFHNGNYATTTEDALRKFMDKALLYTQHHTW